MDDQVAYQVLEKQIVGDAKRRPRRRASTLLGSETKRELMEGHQVHIEQRQPALDGQQATKAIENGFRWDDDGNGRPCVVSFEALDQFDERSFERGMKGAGDDLEHQE